jgi:rare lipoprotein A
LPHRQLHPRNHAEHKPIIDWTDRGPLIGDRVIDLSERAARDLDMVEQGIAEVRLERVARP